ncbi:MAG TPA: GH25 family lysozyme [Planctomycetota bacterium]|nr:GH25 family lysozyme [Planctomycetota bacterium]
MWKHVIAAAVVLAAAPMGARGEDLNQKLFDVTVTDEGGTKVVGKATAELVSSDAAAGVATYSLVRTVGGTSAQYKNGTAFVDAGKGTIFVTFKKDPAARPSATTTGIARAIDEQPAPGTAIATTTPEGDVTATLQLDPHSDANVHLFTTQWSADGHTYSEQWRELTNTVKGVDVSQFQLQVDWKTVKRAGISFAFCRVGDGNFVDPTFARNWAGIKNAGLVRGVYQFFRASKDPIAQADILVAHVGKLAPGDLPPVLDAEVMDGVDVATFNANMKKWIARIEEKLGRSPIIYTGSFFWDALRSPDVGTHDLWLAQYPRGLGPSGPAPDAKPILPKAWKAWKFWQYSDEGSFPGIPAQVDVSLFNGTLADLLAYAFTGTSPDAGAPEPEPPAKPTITSTLRVGASGAEVTALQLALGLKGSDADGIFGPNTKQAVEDFQRSRGLTVDGIAGPNTLAVLGLGAATADEGIPAPVAPAKPQVANTLRAGARGADVTTLQRALGLSGSAADGIFGPNTKKAVEDFQRSKGLTVDGVAGPDTLKALGLR